MNKYYLRFDLSADINYLHLFLFYDIAEYSIEDKAYNRIKYRSIAELSNRLGLSNSTVSRILNNDEYKKFMIINKGSKEITLLNTFKEKKEVAFVCLNKNIVNLLKYYNDNLFCKYVIYIKYYCGYSKTNNTDFTAKQFLSAFGYCATSNSYLNKLNRYNAILVENNIIKITKYRDELGHTRNKYNFIG